jgi:hypothetical protein
MHHLKHYKETGTIRAFQFDKRIQGLLPEQAIGYIARQGPIDYGDVPAWYRQWVRGFLLPFFTFHQKNALNIANIIMSMPGHPKESLKLVAQIATPVMVIQGINMSDPMRLEASKKLGEHYGGSMLTVIVKTYDDTGDGHPNRALIWSPSTPIDEAGEWVQARRFVALMKATKYRDDKGRQLLTVEEAVKRYIGGFPEETARNLNRFIHPLLQWGQGILTNKDPYDGHAIVPAHKEGLPAYMKLGDYSRYMVEKWSISVGRFSRQASGRAGEALSTEWGGGQMPEELSKFVGIFTNGPLNITRAMGLRMIDLDSVKRREIVNAAREPAAWTNYYIGKLQIDYINKSNLLPEGYVKKLQEDIIAGNRTTATDIIDKAAEKGLDFTNIIAGDVNDSSSLNARLWQPHVWYDVIDLMTKTEKRHRISGEALTKTEIQKWKNFSNLLKDMEMANTTLPSEQRPEFAETARRVMTILGQGE